MTKQEKQTLDKELRNLVQRYIGVAEQDGLETVELTLNHDLRLMRSEFRKEVVKQVMRAIVQETRRPKSVQLRK